MAGKDRGIEKKVITEAKRREMSRDGAVIFGAMMSLDRKNISPDVLALNPQLAEVLDESNKPASKYGNIRTIFRGLRFASGKEAKDMADLILQDEHHVIFGLRLQVRFPLQGNNSYVADAVYFDEELKVHVVDSKGVRTKEFNIKAKLFAERYGQEIELL